jgi:zinc transporter, ZIP family
MFELCAPPVADGNVGLAFGLVTAAGLSTTMGAALAFVMPHSTGGKNLFLAASLALAAGVMTYVSFVEIFSAKSITAFEACVGQQYAYLYSTLCFFTGIFLTWIFDQVLHAIEHIIGSRRAKKSQSRSEDNVPASSTTADTTNDNLAIDAVSSIAEAVAVEAASYDVANAAAAAISQPPPSVTDTETETATTTATYRGADPESADGGGDQIHIAHEVGHDGHMVAGVYENSANDGRKLMRMGLFAGLALGFHNFPEGLATFVAVLDNPKVGASVAVAIAIHNIPEGICVAMPIYYATGSRKKAFFWATISGLTELVGAFLGWLVLRKVFTQVVYGILFGIISGMMVYISVKELLPTAHRYDPEDKVSTLFLVIGMGIMGLSLVLFKF